ncbi:hypothetical protein ACO03V_01505 [Microbacterium sp. HMH0099]|uniref:hypothetical protein n=1 Tax=Microbacterium sp. HMH0099 TaxID=3414026 RepID=UPI001F8DB558|nr:hypothetical protein [Actinomycetota bacterium]
MDDNIVDARSDVSAFDPAIVVVEGVEVTSFEGVLSRLRIDYPGEDPARIEAVVLREWEAFTAGKPTVIPAAVEEGAREILDQDLHR